MRALFILLLCLNVGVLVFLALPASDDPDPHPPRPVSEGLTIIDEEAALTAAAERDEKPEPRDDEPVQSLEPDNTPPTVGDDTLALAEAASPHENRICLLAPAEDEQAADDLLARVSDEGIGRSRIVTEEDQIFVGYWVYIPPHDSMQGAQDTMAELGDQGLSDYGYVGGDRYEHAVSLGVFSSEARSQRRQAEIEAMGYDTEVGERHRVVTRHAVMLETNSPDTPLPAADWEEVDCADYEA